MTALSRVAVTGPAIFWYPARSGNGGAGTKRALVRCSPAHSLAMARVHLWYRACLRVECISWLHRLHLHRACPRSQRVDVLAPDSDAVKLPARYSDLDLLPSPGPASSSLSGSPFLPLLPPPGATSSFPLQPAHIGYWSSCTTTPAAASPNRPNESLPSPSRPRLLFPAPYLNR